MVGYADDLEKVLQIAEQISRNEWHGKNNANIGHAVGIALTARDECHAEYARVKGPLRAAKYGGFTVLHVGKNRTFPVLGHSWEVGEEIKEFLDSDPQVLPLLKLNDVLNSKLRDLAELLEPVLPRGWDGSWPEDVTSLAELKSYVSSKLSWVRIIERAATRYADEVVLNADCALSQWEYADRPPLPDHPTTVAEAVRQISRVLHWIDAKIEAENERQRGSVLTQATLTDANDQGNREFASSASATSITHAISQAGGQIPSVAPPIADWDGLPATWSNYKPHLSQDYGHSGNLLRDAFIYVRREAGDARQKILNLVNLGIGKDRNWNPITDPDSVTYAAGEIARFFGWPFAPKTSGRRRSTE